MSTYQELIEGFKAKQEAILKADATAQEAKQALDAKVEAFINEHKGPVEELLQAAENMKQEYRAEIKAAFGITDGERTNVLDVVEMVHRVVGLQ
jgi:hypothetical protein